MKPVNLVLSPSTGTDDARSDSGSSRPPLLHQSSSVAASQAAYRDDRAGLAIVANCVTPYRVHLHTLVAARIPEVKLHSLFTHGSADFAWTVECPPEIHASYFGPADPPLASVLHAPLAEWRKGERIIHYLRENNIRAVILQGYRYISYLRTIDYCHRAGIPLFYRNDSNIRGERLSGIRQWAKSRIYSWWMPRVSGVMSMGEYGDQFFLKYGADPTRIYRVPYWPDYAHFAQCDPARLERFFQQFRLKANRRRLLYSGRFVPQKHVHLLIDAFVEVADQRPDWDLLIVGDGRLRDVLRGRIPDRLRERFIWTGFLNQQDCSLAYHAAEGLVIPSEREPWGVVVQEAMAAGLTVIASDAVGSARELVTDHISGRIFSVGSLEGLIAAIIDVTGASVGDYRQHAREALAAWRIKADPIPQIRRALTDCGVIPK
jgi:glycosyltransferase involved in cell wall biosynthesis